MVKIADVVIVGAGASGLMCAMEAGKRGRQVLVVDHADKPGRKILMSGGGHCNFTNRSVEAGHYRCRTPDFCKSALSRFTQRDFLALVKKHRIAFVEREHGRLFCEHGARDILRLLLTECERAGVNIQLHTAVSRVLRLSDRSFEVQTDRGPVRCQSLVAATGGLSIPKAGASPLGYQIAAQFGINVWPTSAGLVPLTLQPKDKVRLSALSGISVLGVVSNGRESFCENILFTHRGLSGPAILRISNYWRPGQVLTINLLPNVDLQAALEIAKKKHHRKQLKTVLGEWLPKRLIAAVLDDDLAGRPLQDLSHQQLIQTVEKIRKWEIKPGGTEGYRTAEVTVGGVDCSAVSSKTMEALTVPGLFFVGEVLDVTGDLGGYNLQWAWSSGWCAGQAV